MNIKSHLDMYDRPMVAVSEYITVLELVLKHGTPNCSNITIDPKAMKQAVLDANLRNNLDDIQYHTEEDTYVTQACMLRIARKQPIAVFKILHGVILQMYASIKSPDSVTINTILKEYHSS